MFPKFCRLTNMATRSLIVKHSSRDIHCRKIVFEEFGDPLKVTKLVEEELPDVPGDEQVV